ncbi:MAG: hypothetical protein Q9191_007395 [Dirinaria sp. TL-2023a]
MIQAFLAPEFVVILATIQKIEARRSVRQFKEAGFPQWTTRHGFYANMGGFVLQPLHSKSFPINATQLLYLVRQGYIPYPEIKEPELVDASKQDSIQQFLTLVQLLWFVLQCVGRAAQRLPTTTLEIATIGLVICAFLTYHEWDLKPLDVEKPMILTSDERIETVLINAGDSASAPYIRTPLDFVDEQTPSWLTRIQPHIKWKIFSPPERPLPRFTNDRLPVIDGSRDSILLVLVVMAYSSIHFVAWNFNFPTKVEQIIWRVDCIVMVSAASIFFASEFYFEGVRTGRWSYWWSKMSPGLPRLSRDQRSTSVMNIKEEDPLPTWQVAIMLAVTVVYTIARMHIAVECFVTLRSLPLGAFDTVQWSNFLPHF